MLGAKSALVDVPFAWCFWPWFAALVVYYSNERSLLHRVYSERIFCFCMYAWAAFMMLLLPDSPVIRLLQVFVDLYSIDSVAVVALAGYFGVRAHWKGRSSRLVSTIQRLDLRELAALQAETVEARMATARIAQLLAKKHRRFGAARSYKKERKLIFEILQQCCDDGPENLLYVLNSGEVDVPLLLDVAGTPEVYELLQGEILHMDVVTKARLIDAMQRQTDFLFLRMLQETVVKIIILTGGKELSTLKSLLDEGGDYYNLHKLIFFDLADDLREEALQHVETEGRRVRNGKDRLLWKVLSDIDDTLYSSGGHFPAGSDHRLPKHQVYPGVLALFRELGRQDTDEDVASSAMTGAVPLHPVQDPLPSIGSREHISQALFENLMSVEPASMSMSLSLGASFSKSLCMGRTGSSMAPADSTRRISDVSEESEVKPRESDPLLQIPVWIRPRSTFAAEDNWIEMPVSPHDTLGDLQQRVVESGSAEEGIADISFLPPTRRAMSNLVFLSARPHAYKDYFENKTYQLFRKLRARGMLHCMPTLLAGRIGSSTVAALRGAVLEFHSVLRAAFPLLLLAAVLAHRNPFHPQALLCLVMVCLYVYFSDSTRKKFNRVALVWQPVGEDKKRTFMEYRQLYSECDIVFLGDNGQGDLLCCEKLLEDVALEDEEEGRGRVLAFIHEVVPLEEQLSSLETSAGDKGHTHTHEDRGIFFHKTYIRAAINAYESQLIPLAGLARVARSAVEDMVRICATFPGVDFEGYIAELNSDVEEVNELLQAGQDTMAAKPLSQYQAPGAVTSFKSQAYGPVDRIPSALNSWQSMGKSPSLKAFHFSTAPPRPQ